MLRNYLKIALKVLLRRKFFTFVSLFAVSFTLLVLMVATALLDDVFSAQTPETEAARSLYVMRMRMSGPRGSRSGAVGYGFLSRYLKTLPDVEAVAIGSEPNQLAIYHDGRKIGLYLKRVDADWWRALRYEFVEGGPYGAEDDRAANHVAVINVSTRDRVFGGGPALGRTLELDGASFRVVGVVRDVPITRIVGFGDMFVPISTLRTDGYKRELVGDFFGVILAKSAADFPAIRAEFAQRLRTAQLPDPKMWDTLSSGADTLFEAVARFLSPNSDAPGQLFALIAGGALAFMLLPTVNLVNLNLSRILERTSEIGVRKAFGASSLRLVGQFVVENVVLTLVGGALGWVLSALALAALNSSGLLPYARFGLNLRVFGYGLVLAVLFGVLSGVYPAWRMSRLHPVQALRGRFS
ncbi:MAG TPA: ABC transporter permease [Candidatus Polarisedimenticolaceae bacterium]|nr:ABC transporter permease [Candidatus Polarisedimenticolaceae bacterium]